MTDARLSRSIGAITAIGLLIFAQGIAAEEVDSAQYGVAPGGMPLGVALDKGFFKEFGADIDAVRSSPGGGTDIRMLLGGDLPYAESSLGGFIAAVKNGADLKIVSEPVHTVSEVLWVAMPNTTITSLKDLKGKRISFSNPQSTTQALDFLLVEAAGYKQDEVKLTATGGFAQGLTALENGGVDLAVIAEPMFTLSKGKYKPVFWASDVFPPINNVVGVSSTKTIREKPELLRGIIAGRRKAVQFMRSNRAESVPIIAKAYKTDPAVIAAIVDHMLDHGSVNGVPYWGEGDLNYEDLNNMVKAMRLVGIIQGEVEWTKIVDESFLPEDLKSKK
jgi:NitT/TauT family transport system substrate-binding protein